jgi:hypothetical protein
MSTAHNRGLWPCWRREGSLDEYMVLITHIPKPIIKSSYATWRWNASSPHTWHNILLSEVVRKCPLASSRRDIVVDRAGVQPLAACSIIMRRLVTFLLESIKLFRFVRSSMWESILSCEGSNPCSVNYNILPRRGQWALETSSANRILGRTGV